MVRARLTALIVALGLASGGCGDEAETRPPAGPLAEALAATGGGGANGSLGVGWADPQLVEDAGAGPRLIAAALGPNAGSVIEAAPALRRRFGLDSLGAEQLVSIGGSYAFGLRIDGADGRRLGRALVAAGGRSHEAGELRLIEVGDYAVVPQPLLDAEVRGLGAFDAVGGELTVMAISDRARASLLGRGGRLLEQPIYRAAADCLGEVVAARMVPDKLLLAAELGVSVVAMGTDGESDVLCLLGGSGERAATVATNLESSLAPEATEPVSGRRLSESVAAVEVTRGTYEGVEVVRAEVTPAPGARPGFFFGTVARGSLNGLINASSAEWPGA